MSCMSCFVPAQTETFWTSKATSPESTYSTSELPSS